MQYTYREDIQCNYITSDDTDIRTDECKQVIQLFK